MLHCWCVGPELQKRDEGFRVCCCWVVTMCNSKFTALYFALRSKIFFRCVSCLRDSYAASCCLLPWIAIVQLLPQGQPAHSSVCLQSKMVLHQLCAADEYVRRGVAGKQRIILLSMPRRGCRWAGWASTRTERSWTSFVCEAKGLGVELGVFCQQNAASSIEQAEGAAGYVFTAEIVQNTAELDHKCV